MRVVWNEEQFCCQAWRGAPSSGDPRWEFEPASHTRPHHFHIVDVWSDPVIRSAALYCLP